jgi:hypothetical protein
MVDMLVVGREYAVTLAESRIAGSSLRPETDEACDDRTDGPEDDSESAAVLGEGLMDMGIERACDDGTEDTDEKCSWNFEGTLIGVRGCMLGVGQGDGGNGASGGGCRGDGGGPCCILRCRNAGVLPVGIAVLDRCLPLASLPLG